MDCRDVQALLHPYSDGELDLVRHLQVEHQNASPESSVRRRLEDRLLETRERFDRALAEWVPDEELQRAWRDYAEHHAPEPAGPPAIEPLVFCGISDAGSTVEIRGRADDLQVEVDGVLVERIVGAKDFASTGPPVVFRLNGSEVRETFGAPVDALEALSDFVDGNVSPPWEYASDLLADGLIDARFAVTPRGRRALGARAA